MKKNLDLTEGSIPRALLTLSIPIIFANILQTAYQLTDTFWVGRLGTEAVAAVSLSFPIIFLLISLGAGFALAGTILVAQYKGKKDQGRIDHIATQTIILVVFLSILFAIAGYLMTDPILTLMGAEKAIFADAESYLRISFWGIIFLFGYFVFQSLMRGIGEVRTPLYIVTGTVLLNLFLDPMFILGFGPIPAYGVSGAAIATVSTQGLATVVGFSILFSGRYGIHIRPENFRIDLGVMKKMLALGIPASIQQSTRALNFLVMTILVASFGTLAVASYGIGFRVLSFIIIPALGLMMANSTLVGQNMGANKIERAVKTSFFSAIFAFVGLTVVGIVLFIFAHQIAAAFLPGETEVIEASALFIRIMALSFGFLGIQRVLGGTLQGAGSPMTAMALSLTTSWVFNFPLAYVLSKHTSLGMAGIWWSFPISNVLGALITYIVYARGTWKNKRLTEDTDLGTEVARETAIEDNL